MANTRKLSTKVNDPIDSNLSYKDRKKTDKISKQREINERKLKVKNLLKEKEDKREQFLKLVKQAKLDCKDNIKSGKMSKVDAKIEFLKVKTGLETKYEFKATAGFRFKALIFGIGKEFKRVHWSTRKKMAMDFITIMIIIIVLSLLFLGLDTLWMKLK